MQKAISKYWPVFVLPTLIAFIIGFIWPFIWGIYLSFQRFTTVSKTTFVGIQNYISVFQDSTFLHAFGFTAAFTVVSTVLINVCAFAIALVLTRGIKGTNLFRTVFFMPNLIGGIVLGYIWQLIINGILVRLLGWIHRSQDGEGLLQGQGVARQGSGVVGILYLELPLLLENFLHGDGGPCLFQLFFLLF